ncbi:MAG: succinylglutamate desuccinylase/aspartoacylase family protein [Candidatus Buchananbacteria bacterium]
MKKQILFIIATHGNEKIGIEAVKILENKGLEKYFDVLIANPKALEKNVRLIEADLNRSYPGDAKSKIYEERIAFENFKIAKKYRYIIDLHEASQGTDDFIIMPRKKLSKTFPLEFINLKKVLLWPDPKGPISQILKNAIELEFGSKNRPRKLIINRCTLILENFIKNIHQLPDNKITGNKKIFYVYGKLLTNKNIELKLIDFKKVKIEKEKFYPLLTNQYIKDGIACYKMKKL